MKKIGLYFGSFNPIHTGHLIIANTIVSEAKCEVWFVVSPQNPFKPNKSLLHEFDRLTMVEKAISDNFKFKATDIEFSLPKPSYTIDTLTYIQEKFPNYEFILIIGEDNLNQFKNWKNYEKILDNHSLIVYPRPNSLPHEFHKHPKVSFIKAPLLDISATYIRDCIRKNCSIQYLVPKDVEAYIQWKKFYL